MCYVSVYGAGKRGTNKNILGELGLDKAQIRAVFGFYYQ